LQNIKIDDFGCLPLALLIAAVMVVLAVDRVADSLDDLANSVAAQHTK
jgi:hypothetical protein